LGSGNYQATCRLDFDIQQPLPHLPLPLATVMNIIYNKNDLVKCADVPRTQGLSSPSYCCALNITNSPRLLPATDTRVLQVCYPRPYPIFLPLTEPSANPLSHHNLRNKQVRLLSMSFPGGVVLALGVRFYALVLSIFFCARHSWSSRSSKRLRPAPTCCHSCLFSRPFSPPRPFSPSPPLTSCQTRYGWAKVLS